MRKQILKIFTVITLVGGTSSCGESFLETDYYKGVDVETGLNSVNNIKTALNGTYYQLFRQYFAGNYAINIGDIPTDIAYWNTLTGHFDDIYTYTFTDTDLYLEYIWDYGYKVVDNSVRIIQASKALYENSNDADKEALDLYMAEAYALRGYAQLLLTNIYAHQVKVNGTDFSSEKGIVVIEKPIEAFSKVNTDLKLVIAGGSSDTDEYEKELRMKAEKDSRILFTGFVEGDLLEELYSNAYVYTLPSDLEGMPLSLLEAMSYENCCLVSDIKELTEVVEDKAVVFPHSNTEALAEKLQYLCNHPAVVTEYQEIAADFICKKYDWDTVTDKTLRLYEDIRKI